MWNGPNITSQCSSSSSQMISQLSLKVSDRATARRRRGQLTWGGAAGASRPNRCCQGREPVGCAHESQSRRSCHRSGAEQWSLSEETTRFPPRGAPAAVLTVQLHRVLRPPRPLGLPAPGSPVPPAQECSSNPGQQDVFHLVWERVLLSKTHVPTCRPTQAPCPRLQHSEDGLVTLTSCRTLQVVFKYLG